MIDTGFVRRQINSRLQPWSILVALSLVVTVTGALVPSSVMGWLRVVVPGFAPAWDWLDASLPGLNPMHIIAYAWVALLWRLLSPRGSGWQTPALLVLVGAACEWLQRYIPTREPRWTDVLSDAIGIAIGWGLAMAVNWMWRRA